MRKTSFGNFTIPIIDYLLRTNCIEILTDSRMNEQKIEKIKSILCKSDRIGTVKERFFFNLARGHEDRRGEHIPASIFGQLP